MENPAVSMWARPNSVWHYDFVHDQLVDGRVLKMQCVIDEYTRECLAMEVVPACA